MHVLFAALLLCLVQKAVRAYLHCRESGGDYPQNGSVCTGNSGGPFQTDLLRGLTHLSHHLGLTHLFHILGLFHLFHLLGITHLFSIGVTHPFHPTGLIHLSWHWLTYLFCLGLTHLYLLWVTRLFGLFGLTHIFFLKIKHMFCLLGLTHPSILDLHTCLFWNYQPCFSWTSPHVFLFLGL